MMKNMLSVAAGYDMLPLLHSLVRQPEIFGLFGAAPEVAILREYRADTGALANYPTFDMVPQAHPLVFGIMARIFGKILGRISIVRVDSGKEFEYRHMSGYDTYIAAIAAAPGCSVTADGNISGLVTGGITWVKHHSLMLTNNSNQELFVLLCEIDSLEPCSYVPEN